MKSGKKGIASGNCRMGLIIIVGVGVAFWWAVSRAVA